MSSLSDEQQAAVLQLRELTNGGDDDVAINVLRSVDWDVQRAADLVFGGGGSMPEPHPPTTPSPPVLQEFDVDDSEQGHDRRPTPQNTLQQPASIVGTLTRPLFSILSFPLHLLSSIFRFIFGVLRIPFPRFSGLNFYGPLRPRSTYRGGPDRWLRELEEETGAVSIGRLRASKGTSSSLNNSNGASSQAGSSTLSSRGPTSAEGLFDDGRRVLPDFVSGTYDEALRTCQRDIRIGCIILVSEEHDDVAEFKRSTLTDPAFVKALHDNNVLVWGGDVKDREAWSAAEKLQTTTYPFVAFVALQPRRTVGASASARNVAPPSLTVLSRHQGKSTPSSSGPTASQTLVSHLETQVIPRVTSYLDRLRSQQRERERDRQLRDEQDRAFQDAARRDRERIQAKIDAENAQKQAALLAEQERMAEEHRLKVEADVQRREAEIRMDWRRWTRKALSGREGTSTKNLRVAIRLPNGERTIQQFASNDTLTTLYATVDSYLIPSNFDASKDPAALPGGDGPLEVTLENHLAIFDSPAAYWGFRIASAYPRVEIPWERDVELSTISHLKGGGQVVVEPIETSFARNIENGHDSDDGYDTEED